MSACSTVNRRILINIMNMENLNDKMVMEKVSDNINEICEMTGVQAEPTPAAAASSLPALEQVSLSTGVKINKNDYLSRKLCPKLLANNCRKFESGSGSGDQEGGQHEDGTDIATKKRKTRRGKPKRRKLKPYSKQQMSYQQQLRYKYKGRLAKTGRHPPAPYNTTQFLMDDHSDLPDLDQKLSARKTDTENPDMFQKPLAPSRTRDSSFSVDSDEDYFYSSPEDEKEFLTKEFSTAYEDLHAERLSALSKLQLIQEYLQLEAKVDLLTKRLRGKFHQTEQRETESTNGSTDPEYVKKLKLFQQQIDDLIQQNEQLKRENELLRAKRHSSPISSVDSESDSDSTSNENRSRRNFHLPYSSSSSELGYVSRSISSQVKDSSAYSTDSKSDSCDSLSENSKASTTPVNL